MVEAENALGNSLDVYITVRDQYYAVCLGPFETRDEAVYQQDLLKTLGYYPIAAIHQ